MIVTVQEHHFTMRSLQPACIEYDSDLPWNDSSISALIHLLLTPIYPASSAPTQPVAFGPSTLVKLYSSMRDEAILRAEEVANLVTPPPESPSTPAKGFNADPSGSRPSTAHNNHSSTPAPRVPIKTVIKPTINGILIPEIKEPPVECYPPVHLLAAVIGRLWKEKDSLNIISFDSGNSSYVLSI